MRQHIFYEAKITISILILIEKHFSVIIRKSGCWSNVNAEKLSCRLEESSEAKLLKTSPADIQKLCVCVSACPQKAPNLRFPPLQTMPDEHPPMPPPSRWLAFITLPPLAKFQLVWRRLCGALLSSSSLARQAYPSLLSRVCLTYVGDSMVVLP